MFYPQVSPPEETLSSDSCQHGLKIGALIQQTPRRPRVPYREEEVLSLVKGVGKYGRSWNQILSSYKFQPNRTATDLKDKYKRLSVS